LIRSGPWRSQRRIDSGSIRRFSVPRNSHKLVCAGQLPLAPTGDQAISQLDERLQHRTATAASGKVAASRHSHRREVEASSLEGSSGRWRTHRGTDGNAVGWTDRPSGGRAVTVRPDGRLRRTDRPTDRSTDRRALPRRCGRLIDCPRDRESSDRRAECSSRKYPRRDRSSCPHGSNLPTLPSSLSLARERSKVLRRARIFDKWFRNVVNRSPCCLGSVRLD
jgi:hypothetical protein